MPPYGRILSLDDFHKRTAQFATQAKIDVLSGQADATVEQKVPEEYRLSPSPVINNNQNNNTNPDKMLAARRRASIMYDNESSTSEEMVENEVDTEPEAAVPQPTQPGAQVQRTTAQLQNRTLSQVMSEEDSDRSSADSGVVQGTPAPPATTTLATIASRSDTTVDHNRFIALADWTGDEEGDLAIKKGDLLKILELRADGWWKAVNTLGFVGNVPKTFLKHFDPTDVGPSEHLAVRNLNPPPEPDPVPQRQPVRPVGVPKIQIPAPGKPSCLGEALAQDVHLTGSCHLAPRLSRSNLAFHDIYWNFEADKLQKREVSVVKLVRLVRIDGMEKRPSKAHLVRIALIDLSKTTGRQIVSNVHTIMASNKNGTWTFSNRQDGSHDIFHFSDVIVRSNYKSPEVALLIEASIIEDNESTGHPEEISVGVAKVPLIYNQVNGTRLANRTYTEIMLRENVFNRNGPGIRTGSQIVFRVTDVPMDLVPYVDSLPDVLLLPPQFARLTFFYRRRLGEALLRDRERRDTSELLYDPFLASFPRAFDQSDLLEYCRRAFQPKHNQIAKKSESEQLNTFFSYFMETAFVLLDNPRLPPFSHWDMRAIMARHQLIEEHAQSVLENKGNVQFLLTHPSRPIDVFAYAVDPMGRHAID
ncbi:unnamed protein product, partial [Mesorhabditis spiculigera]